MTESGKIVSLKFTDSIIKSVRSKPLWLQGILLKHKVRKFLGRRIFSVVHNIVQWSLTTHRTCSSHEDEDIDRISSSYRPSFRVPYYNIFIFAYAWGHMHAKPHSEDGGQYAGVEACVKQCSILVRICMQIIVRLFNSSCYLCHARTIQMWAKGWLFLGCCQDDPHCIQFLASIGHTFICLLYTSLDLFQFGRFTFDPLLQFAFGNTTI